MRKLFIVLVIALVCAACEKFDALPEPELPVVEIEFNVATYYPATQSITLFISSAFDYDGIYEYYNKRAFTITPYLKNKGLGIISTEVDAGAKQIKINLAGDTLPSGFSGLIFNTKKPMYLGSKAEFWRNTTVVAKGYIKTVDLSVSAGP